MPSTDYNYIKFIVHVSFHVKLLTYTKITKYYIQNFLNIKFLINSINILN